MRSLLFYIAYFGLLITDLMLIYLQPETNWRPILEPALMILLFIYFRMNCKNLPSEVSRLIYIALSSLTLGGFFLMQEAPLNSFLAGFCFFLIANITYTLKFYRFTDTRLKRVIPFLSVAYLMAISLLYYFYDAFGYYFLPAFFYIFVLLNCLQFAFLRYRVVNTKSFLLVLAGVILFLLGQVIAAVYYFLTPEAYMVSLMIGFFFISQAFIIQGVLSNDLEYVESGKFENKPEQDRVKDATSP